MVDINLLYRLLTQMLKNLQLIDHIDDLKEKIYEEVKKKHNDFLDIEAEDLRLWKVEINNSSDDEFSSLVLKNDNTKNITKLRGTIREFWDDDEKRPKVGCTHIIVDSLRLVERRKMDNHIQDQGEGLNLLIGQLREMGLQNPGRPDI
uniref:Crinkler effector protein N-terminal domain-containing protein n=1 Tax=Rhizophagus irregularis (strain DAOM 181602 / DAOM 197198 / MUCL 43194) TaxID=747089 RepID=U9T2R5_RHIID